MKVNLLKVLRAGFKIENSGNRFNIIEILYALSMPWGWADCFAKNFYRFEDISGRETSLFPESVEEGLTFNPGSGFSFHQKRGSGDGGYNITRN